MSDSAVHFSDSAASEQEVKGVKTGFDLLKALVFLQEKTLAWKESGRLDVQLLRGLCLLSQADPVKASQGFASWDLVESICKVRGRPWSDALDKARMSDDIRLQWNNLLKTWDTKSEGIAQLFADAQFGFLPLLQKTEGGGTGNPTLYRIDWVPAKPEMASPMLDQQEEISDPNSRAIRYVCEDIEEANPFARIFTRGFQLKGWRKQVYIVLLAAPLLFLWLLLVQIALGVTLSAAIGGKTVLTSLLSSAVIFWAVMASVGPMYRLGVDRIVIAPWWMQSVDEDRLLERRSPPRHSDKSIKAVRYVAKCPLCGGKVSATKGRLEFFGRIVGRCEEAPVEHAFSFDHITRNGKLLR
ncbi:MAG: hypothetical protein HGA71_09795 [Azonexaceae bacterium]|nr:hypothetical protein [Azonexaceae bacterium]